MKKTYSKRRFPRKHTPKNVSEPLRSRLGVWIGRGIWFLAGGLASLLVAFLSQGPDAIRKIPEIPKAITETVNSVIEEREIDRGLTNSWEYQPTSQATSTKIAPILLELSSEKGRILGEFHSSLVRKWTIYDMALVEGTRNGKTLHLTVYEFIYGKRTRLAQLDVRFQEDGDGILDHIPELVDSELKIETTWQKGNVLPKSFSVRRVSK